jgi:endonuclease YncB( thermonuclease family)
MLRALMLALIGGGAFAAVYVATAPRPSALPETPTKTASLGNPSLQDVPPVSFELRPATSDEPELRGESVAAEIRDVTPTNMTVRPTMALAPMRVEPAAETEPAAPANTLETGRERLFNPVVNSAGAITFDGRDLRLAEIAAPALDKRCGAKSTSWPCGRMARTALRRFIRGRAVECELPEGADAIPDPARCFVAGDNIAEWLVAQGWAESDGDTFTAVEESARTSKRGLWGDGWPGGQSGALAADD